MLPLLRGRKPFAVILCSFPDRPPPRRPLDELRGFALESGRFGLFDYWRDISNGMISIAGSDVLGWYELPFTSAEVLPNKRADWFSRARDLARTNGVDLSKYYGVIVVVDNPSDVGALGGTPDILQQLVSPVGQTGWRLCSKCTALTYFGDPGRRGICPKGGEHDDHGSGDYAIGAVGAPLNIQKGWARCKRCECLVQGANGPCEAALPHDLDSITHALVKDTPAMVADKGQAFWRFCSSCHALADALFCRRPDTLAQPGVIFCAKEGAAGHKHKGSSNYTVPIAFGGTARFCRWCNCLAFGAGVCPSPNKVHDFTGSLTYAVATGTLGGGEDQWQECAKCQVLFHGAADSKCPQSGGAHVATGMSYSLLMNTPFTGGQDDWRLCSKCRRLVYPGRGGGQCSDGALHVSAGSPSYVLETVAPYELGFTAHETGHALGLEHSWGPAGSQTTASAHYGDSTDIMSWRSSSVSYAEVYRPSGPGLNAPKLHKLGWMPPERVWTRRLDALGPEAIRLAPLGNPRVPAYLMAQVIYGDVVISISYRARIAWDAAIASAHIEVHEQRSLFGVSENGWRHCSNCSGLVNARNMVCSAGGTHSALEQFRWLVPAPGSSTSGEVFSRCAKCQMLLRSERAPCAAGGLHAAVPGVKYAPPQATGTWATCAKCEALVPRVGDRMASCPAGGDHCPRSTPQYSLLADLFKRSAWHACSKCSGLFYGGTGACRGHLTHDTSASGDYAIFAGNAAGTSNQNGWRLCSKCRLLVHSSGDVSCPGLGTHDFTDSQSYSLTHSPTGVAATLQATSPVVLPTGVSSIDIAGQSGWKYCNRCHVLAFSAGNSCVDGKPHDLAGSNYTVGNNSLDYTHVHTTTLAAPKDSYRVGKLRIVVDDIDDVARIHLFLV